MLQVSKVVPTTREAKNAPTQATPAYMQSIIQVSEADRRRFNTMQKKLNDLRKEKELEEAVVQSQQYALVEAKQMEELNKEDPIVSVLRRDEIQFREYARLWAAGEMLPNDAKTLSQLIPIHKGKRVSFKHYKFEPYIARVGHHSDVQTVLDKHYATITQHLHPEHRVQHLSYAIVTDNGEWQGMDDGGETGAGARLLHFLRQCQVNDVILLLSQSYRSEHKKLRAGRGKRLKDMIQTCKPLVRAFQSVCRQLDNAHLLHVDSPMPKPQQADANVHQFNFITQDDGENLEASLAQAQEGQEQEKEGGDSQKLDQVYAVGQPVHEDRLVPIGTSQQAVPRRKNACKKKEKPKYNQFKEQEYISPIQRFMSHAWNEINSIDERSMEPITDAKQTWLDQRREIRNQSCGVRSLEEAHLELQVLYRKRCIQLVSQLDLLSVIEFVKIPRPHFLVRLSLLCLGVVFGWKDLTWSGIVHRITTFGQVGMDVGQISEDHMFHLYDAAAYAGAYQSHPSEVNPDVQRKLQLLTSINETDTNDGVQQVNGALDTGSGVAKKTNDPSAVKREDKSANDFGISQVSQAITSGDYDDDGNHSDYVDNDKGVITGLTLERLERTEPRLVEACKEFRSAIAYFQLFSISEQQIQACLALFRAQTVSLGQVKMVSKPACVILRWVLFTVRSYQAWTHCYLIDDEKLKQEQITLRARSIGQGRIPSTLMSYDEKRRIDPRQRHVIDAEPSFEGCNITSLSRALQNQPVHKLPHAQSKHRLDNILHIQQPAIIPASSTQLILPLRQSAASSASSSSISVSSTAPPNQVSEEQDSEFLSDNSYGYNDRSGGDASAIYAAATINCVAPAQQYQVIMDKKLNQKRPVRGFNPSQDRGVNLSNKTSSARQRARSNTRSNSLDNRRKANVATVDLGLQSFSTAPPPHRRRNRQNRQARGRGRSRGGSRRRWM